MSFPLRYSTASQEVPLGHFLDSLDGNTEETGLSITNTDIKLHKAGGTSLTSKNSGGATHMSNGVYYAVLDATDSNTIGPLTIFVHVSGALSIKVECIVFPAEVFDYLFAAAGTDYFQVDLAQIASAAVNAASAQIGANIVNWKGSAAPDNTGDAYARLGAPAGASVSADLATIDSIVDTIVARVIGTLAAGTHNAQSGDAYARLGAPAGASVSADLATIDTVVDAIKAKTDCLPTATVVTGSVVTDAGNSASSFKTDLSSAVDDFWKDALLLISSGALAGQVKRISAYNGTTKFVTVGAFTSTPADGVTFVLVNK